MGRVHLICVSDRPKALPVLLHALIVQTFEDWRCTVLDQSGDGACVRAAYGVKDRRIVARPVERVGDWGQTVKAREAASSQMEYLGFPNDDAYYAPTYLARMVDALDAGNALVYCDWVFDKFDYCGMTVQPVTGWIDVGGFLVRRDALLEVGWHDRGQTGDGQLIERLVASGKPHQRVRGLLYVKN